MAEKPPNPIPGPWTQIRWITAGLLFTAKLTGKGIGALIGVVRKTTNASASARASEIVHDIMYAGVQHLPGTPRPSVRTTALTPDELNTFTAAANILVSLDALPADVASFARTFNIRLKG